MGGNRQTVGEFQADQKQAEGTESEEAPALTAVETPAEKPKLPGDVVAKFEGQAWDLLPAEALKIGAERELVVRISVVGGGERRMASGIVRHHVNLKVVGVALVPPDEERFPQMPRGNYADQMGRKVPPGQLEFEEDSEE